MFERRRAGGYGNGAAVLFIVARMRGCHRGQVGLWALAAVLGDPQAILGGGLSKGSDLGATTEAEGAHPMTHEDAAKACRTWVTVLIGAAAAAPARSRGCAWTATLALHSSRGAASRAWRGTSSRSPTRRPNRSPTSPRREARCLSQCRKTAPDGGCARGAHRTTRKQIALHPACLPTSRGDSSCGR